MNKAFHNPNKAIVKYVQINIEQRISIQAVFFLSQEDA